jgi:hypothetical protein
MGATHQDLCLPEVQPHGGGQLVTDLYQAAVNFTARTGAGLEVEHTRHVYARFVKNNMEMKMAL